MCAPHLSRRWLRSPQTAPANVRSAPHARRTATQRKKEERGPLRGHSRCARVPTARRTSVALVVRRAPSRRRQKSQRAESTEATEATEATAATEAGESAAACCTPARGGSEKRGSTWVVSLATGMATSGCCLLQLGLNLLPAFSTSGCFGFNTHLKKLRPLFAAGTVLWFVRWAWRDFGAGRAPPASEEERRSRRAAVWRFVLTAAASLLISLSPEIIAFVSRRRAASAMLAAAEKITIDVLDMGCEACSEAVGRALRALPGAAGGVANFKDGTATLFVKQGAAGTMSADAIQKALAGVGYRFGGIASAVRL